MEAPPLLKYPNAPYHQQSSSHHPHPRQHQHHQQQHYDERPYGHHGPLHSPGYGRPYDRSGGPPAFSGHKRDSVGAPLHSGSSYARHGHSSADALDGSFAKLFVGSVPRTITEEQVRPMFAKYGDVVEVAILKDKRTGQQQGCCFIKYATVEEAERAIKHIHNQQTLPGGTAPVQVRFADGERERLGALEHKLFVGCVNKQATEKDIEEIFAQYGRVDDVYIMKDESKHSRGCAFVKYPTREMALSAINALDGSFIMEGCEQPLSVRFAEPKRTRTGDARVGGPGFGPGSFSPKQGLSPLGPRADFRPSSFSGRGPLGWHHVGMTGPRPMPETVNFLFDMQGPTRGLFNSPSRGGLFGGPSMPANGFPQGGPLSGPPRSQGMADASVRLGGSAMPLRQQGPYGQHVQPYSQQGAAYPRQTSPYSHHGQAQQQYPHQNMVGGGRPVPQQKAEYGANAPTHQPSASVGHLITSHMQAQQTQTQTVSSALQQISGLGLHVMPQQGAPSAAPQQQPLPQSIRSQHILQSSQQRSLVNSVLQAQSPPVQSQQPSQLSASLINTQLSSLNSIQPQLTEKAVQSSELPGLQTHLQPLQLLQSLQPQAVQQPQLVHGQPQQVQPLHHQVHSQLVQSWLLQQPSSQQQQSIQTQPQQTYYQQTGTTQQPLTQATWTVSAQQPQAVSASIAWTEHTSPEGYKYYYNSTTGESKWEKPQELILIEQQQQQQQLLQQQQLQQQTVVNPVQAFGQTHIVDGMVDQTKQQVTTAQQNWSWKGQT